MKRSAASEIVQMWESEIAPDSERLSFDAAIRALVMLPEPGVWAVSQDTRALFALVPGEVLFTIALRDGGRVLITRRPLEGDRIIVGLEWAEGKTTRTGGVRHETHWTFRYVDDEPESGEGWQRMGGTVTIDPMGEHPDARERLAREIASRAGWSVFDKPPAGE